MADPNPYRTPSETSHAPGEPTSSLQARSLSWLSVLLMGMLIPGLPSLLLRRDAWGFGRLLILWLLAPVAFAVFGPLWGEVLFDNTRYREWGFYPFIATCLAIPAISVSWGLADRRRLILRHQDHDL